MSEVSPTESASIKAILTHRVSIGLFSSTPTIGAFCPIQHGRSIPRINRSWKKIEPAGNNGLKVSSDRGFTYTLPSDGEDAPVVGPDVVPKITAAGRQVDNHTIEVTGSREGVLANKSTWELSPDGKTMTVTTTRMGPDVSPEPDIEVYERQ